LAETEYPETFNSREIVPLRGKSLLPVFNQEIREQHDFLFWEHEGNRAVRAGDWKLVGKKGGDWELYNLTRDRAELNNLASDSINLLNNLAEKYNQWAIEVRVIQ
jgi:arylsulfatase